MEVLRSAMDDHLDQMSDLLTKFSGELRSSLGPAYDNFIGFFHAIDWKEPWIVTLLGFHFTLLVISVSSRRNLNFQMFFFFFALIGVFLAETINSFLSRNWKSFSGQNYFDPNGVFFSTLWSGPLLCISIIILINTLFTLCHLIVRWKRAELRHRARLAHDKNKND